ncbi:nucleoid occlusion protein [Listeria newyorkensis]|uniref:Nucleoid occlusion protein n=1 Tax=Listeria newyorkensis TaxID=1497681 RepID=A0ABX4XQ01_9LIST|nr:MULTISPECIES: nucleoid occlusion protein [Listeria]KGL41157.1 chromosome partitioning protein ParB [Listeriaceae bacterium FSL A5-0209]KGL41872.1 chromosome partitioning protein ParB [Listeria newyorkensis]PNP94042.1 nucleoid occlusion protein [Listeria newyorkensis]RQW67529.1 nucleoid occlusion protein [Listeria sp. SHR_NRA_18]WAO23217.1 nucleoid occlusion protein [Listeria newyorkensis]
MPFSRLFGKKDKEYIEIETEETVEEFMQQIVELPVAAIIPNRYQPRTVFDASKIEELARTIRIHGVIQPIVVREYEPEKFEIIAGERRFRAVSSLEWDTIPAIVQNLTDDEVASIALIENLQREELTPIEEAKAYQSLLDMQEVTQEALAQRVGKSQSAIANKLRLLRLPEAAQQAVLDKQISERHGRSLLVLETEEKQLDVLAKIIENKWNVKETEQYIQTLLPAEPKPKKAKPKRQAISRDVRIAVNTIKQSITMVKDNGMDLQMEEEESDDYYQITIQIPKQKNK